MARILSGMALTPINLYPRTRICAQGVDMVQDVHKSLDMEVLVSPGATLQSKAAA
jgi:hypothetical protein